MKTNKLWSIMMMLILVLGTAIALSSCSKDEEEESNGLLGYWYPQEQKTQQYIDFCNDFGLSGPQYIDGGESRTYRFVNDDTVEELWVRDCTTCPSSNVVYNYTIKGISVYVKQISKTIYSYVVHGNTIIITNGDILNLYGGKLHSDGGLVLDKVK